MEEPETQRPPLTERPWFIAVLMFAFFPAGLVLFWRHEAWDYRIKWLVTLVVFASVFVVMGRLDI